MSNARSPRGVCSTTIGTRAIGDLLTIAPRPRSLTDRGVLGQEVDGHALAQSLAQGLEVSALLHHPAHRGRRSLGGLREPLQFRVDVGFARGEPFALRDRLEQE